MSMSMSMRRYHNEGNQIDRQNMLVGLNGRVLDTHAEPNAQCFVSAFCVRVSAWGGYVVSAEQTP